jgi:hypothetical protein
MTAATGVELISYGECRLTSRPQSSAWQALDGTPRRSLAVDWAPTKVSSFHNYSLILPADQFDEKGSILQETKKHESETT